jgi:hypothetical protein
MMVDESDIDREGDPVELDDELELANARLEWAKASSRCLDIPSQANAVRWHAHACDEARDAAAADSSITE